MEKNTLTSEESFAILREIEKQKNFRRDENARSEWIQAIKNLVPRVGLGCTIRCGSDEYAATVTEILSPCKIAVRHNQVGCSDYFGAEYEILDELKGEPEIFTKRRNGLWIKEGQKLKDGVTQLKLQYQHHYIDPTF